ncbi:MAG: type II toxin-antitoxin system RelB/DinJ family antitoxin [Clostridia bacterium]|nr:type II toxin-antitoxin system RelB/DinJ family antitoxin [Clostridia bacterium]MBP5593174.1 type II toxin-antitoxin system RelB/DinJ family antitoxin [Clostridia bacterium]MBP5648875.1 type II toxin-antitoxin system RelB/DinJ family antitoxin [Clostridia bacterium]
MATTNLNIRIDEDLKRNAEILFSDLGLNMSSAITIFLKSAVDYRGIPFSIRKTSRTVSVDDEEILAVSKELINKNKQAYEVLAK